MIQITFFLLALQFSLATLQGLHRIMSTCNSKFLQKVCPFLFVLVTLVGIAALVGALFTMFPTVIPALVAAPHLLLC